MPLEVVRTKQLHLSLLLMDFHYRPRSNPSHVEILCNTNGKGTNIVRIIYSYI